VAIGTETIRTSNEIARVLEMGRRYRRPSVTVFVLHRDIDPLPATRIAYIAAKRLGNAVVRNRNKRILRVAWQQCYPQAEKAGVLSGNDILLVANRQTASAGAQVINSELEALFGSRKFATRDLV